MFVCLFTKSRKEIIWAITIKMEDLECETLGDLKVKKSMNFQIPCKIVNSFLKTVYSVILCVYSLNVRNIHADFLYL